MRNTSNIEEIQKAINYLEKLKAYNRYDIKPIMENVEKELERFETEINNLEESYQKTGVDQLTILKNLH